MQTLTALVFDDFETLDLYGVIEIFGRLNQHYQILFASIQGKTITNQHNVSLPTLPIDDCINQTDIALIVGGQGTRTLVDNALFLEKLSALCQQSTWVLSVCTGSALLAKAGLLNGIKSTSNKRAWQWVIKQSAAVDWTTKARWTQDGKFYTSSGVSAGIDMALGFIADRHGIQTAKQIADQIEYRWQPDPTYDEFYERWQGDL